MAELQSQGPLRPLTDLWDKAINAASKWKEECFGRYAREARQFLGEDYDFIYQDGYSPASKSFLLLDEEKAALRPSFSVTANKVFEVVAIFGPSLYHQNPRRTVRPRQLPQFDPALFGGAQSPYFQAVAQDVLLRQQAAEVRAGLLETYLNFTPKELNLEQHCQMAITEALITGRGCVWTEIYQPPGQDMRIPGSFFDTVDNLLVDPDCEQFENAQWIARRCVHPAWMVEEQFGLEKDSVKGNFESFAQQARVNSGGSEALYKRQTGQTSDLVVYYKIWSKSGVGTLLKDSKESYGGFWDQFGKNVYVVFAPGVPYFLNVPDAVLQQPESPELIAEIGRRIAWPIPFHADGDWPVTCLDFYPQSRIPWPTSIIKPAMGELHFMNWAMSFAASKIAKTCRDFIAVLEDASEEVQRTLVEGSDLELIKLGGQHKSINEVVQFLQHPTFNKELWNVLESVERMFDKRTGLTDLAYGQTDVQMRSAQEASIKADITGARPQYMAKLVEAWAARMARKEALAARWFLRPEEDVAPIFGPHYAQLWQAMVYSADVASVSRELDYEVEAGSTRRKNLDQQATVMSEVAQVLGPLYWQYFNVSGDPGPFNAFAAMWLKIRDVDPTPFMVQPPPPPMPMPPAEPQPPGKENRQ